MQSLCTFCRTRGSFHSDSYHVVLSPYTMKKGNNSKNECEKNRHCIVNDTHFNIKEQETISLTERAESSQQVRGSQDSRSDPADLSAKRNSACHLQKKALVIIFISLVI